MTSQEKELIDMAIGLAKDGWPSDFIWERLKEHERLFDTVQENTATSFINSLKKQYTGKD